jgi:hypothetical protein
VTPAVNVSPTRSVKKHHAIPVPEVTATDCILEATHHLNAAIEGVQEAALDELQAIESLRHILLSEQIPQ